MRWLQITDQEAAAGLLYPHEHAAGGETSLMMVLRPDLVNLSLALETDRSLRHYYTGQPDHLQRRKVTPNTDIGMLRGVADESNDPQLSASPERGQQLLEMISEQSAVRAKGLLSEIR